MWQAPQVILLIPDIGEPLLSVKEGNPTQNGTMWRRLWKTKVIRTELESIWQKEGRYMMQLKYMFEVKQMVFPKGKIDLGAEEEGDD